MVDISVLIPVYNVENYLARCLDSVLGQKFSGTFEVICVNDGSTDKSTKILEQYALRYPNLKIITQENQGLAAARYSGMNAAQGEYIGIVDSDDSVDEDYFEKLYQAAKDNNADIAATTKVLMCGGNSNLQIKNCGIKPNAKIIDSKEDKAEIIITTGICWNKIYKREFLNKYDVCKFGNSPGTDNFFTTCSVISANKIAVIHDSAYYYNQRQNSLTHYLKGKKEFGIFENYASIDEWINNQSEFSELDKQYWKFINIKRKQNDFKVFYNTMAPEFKNEFLSTAIDNLKIDNLIVSLTSYPARINTVNQTIETLLNQSVKAEKVVLWLTEEQFPNKEKDLPQQLLDLIPRGLIIDWCEEDIKSYTKLIPSLKKYPNAFIVTADDDILYKNNWLEQLYHAYINEPNYIHCHRAHYITFVQNEILPYVKWKQNIISSKPSFNNFCTGVGGILYPPNCFYKDILNSDLFMSLSPNADDIWFWTMLVLNDLKINIVTGGQELKYVEGSQGTALWYSNVNEGQNDVQLNNIIKHYPELLEKLDKEDTSNDFQPVDVSVIIPVYNVEKYLGRCLDSILKQDFPEDRYEIICVDDGSTDNSLKILQNYSYKYKNLKVITLYNKDSSNIKRTGPGDARNEGVNAAKGEYILFVDSDDFIAKNTLSSLYDFAKKHNSEVVLFDHLRGKSGLEDSKPYSVDVIAKKYGDNSFNIDDVPPIFYDYINVRPWAKFYRTDLIKDIKFPNEIYYQDVPHWTEVYTKAKRMHYLPVPFYYYTIYRNNAISMDQGKKVFDLFVSYSETQKILKKTNYFEKLRNVHYNRIGRLFISRLQTIDDDIREEFVNGIKNFDFDIDYEEFDKENFSQLEKDNIKLIKYIKEHSYDEICNHLIQIGVWNKYAYDVSIIMPVYNVEEYLERCMNSVTRQSFPQNRYEIICVNDGSTDNSLKILQDFAKVHKNIKIITTKNSGPAAARNEGIKIALGKYILFVDSDDFVALNSLEVLYNYAETHNSDVVVFDFYRDIPGTQNPKIRHQQQIASFYKDRQFNAETAEDFVYRFIPMAPWNKLYRTDLIRDIKFPTDTRFDDIPFWVDVYTSAKRINYLPFVLYYYDISRETRLTASQDKRVFDVFVTYNTCRKILEKSGYFEKFKYILYAHTVNSFINYLKAVNEDFREDYINEIKNFKIDVSVEEFLAQDFYEFEYENFKHIKFIQENDYASSLQYLKDKNIF